MVKKRKRRFIDAPIDERCEASIVLKDGSGAQCGRRKREESFCFQHSKLGNYELLEAAKKVVLLSPRIDSFYKPHFYTGALTDLQIAIENTEGKKRA